MTRTSSILGLFLAPLLVCCSVPGDPEVIGHSGVSRGDDGRLILHIIVCERSVVRATVFGPGNPAPTIARWTASEPASGYIRLDPESPPDNWTLSPGSETSIDTDELYSFHATTDGGSTVLADVSGETLQASDGEIFAWDGQRDAPMTEDEFKRLCD